MNTPKAARAANSELRRVDRVIAAPRPHWVGDGFLEE
jgi:hypothetical protein